MHSLEMFVITWLIAHHSILNQTHTGIQHAPISLEIPAVVCVSSLRTDDLNKSPLYPSVQGLRAATYRLTITLVFLTTNHTA